MPIFPPPLPQPWYLGDAGIVAGSTSGVIGINTLCAQLVKVEVPVVSTGMRYRGGGSPTGNVQFGIYDVNGNLLGSSPITAAVGAVATVNYSSNIAITTPGQYYLAMWVSLNTDNFYRLAGYATLLPAIEFTAGFSGGLPSTITPGVGLASSPHCPAILAILQGGMP